MKESIYYFFFLSASASRTCFDDGRPSFAFALSLFLFRFTLGSEESMVKLWMQYR
jgi:hypothetical protein